jgi:cytochrome c-type biogenesis protein
MSVFTIWSMKLINKAKKYMGIIEKISGGILIAVGIYVIYKGLS